MASKRTLAVVGIAVVGLSVIAMVSPFALVALVFWVRTSIAEPFTIPSGGMNPSLPTGTRLWVDKRACQELSDIHRGDVVVFEAEWSDGATYNFIWRVIGLPGEHVVVEGHRVWIDGVLLPHTDERVVGEYLNAQEGGPDATWTIAWPVEDVAHAHRVDDDQVVPDDHVYVLGDNRYDALDSRTTGSVPLSAILGCAFR